MKIWILGCISQSYWQPRICSTACCSTGQPTSSLQSHLTNPLVDRRRWQSTSSMYTVPQSSHSPLYTCSVQWTAGGNIFLKVPLQCFFLDLVKSRSTMRVCCMFPCGNDTENPAKAVPIVYPHHTNLDYTDIVFQRGFTTPLWKYECSQHTTRGSVTALCCAVLGLEQWLSQ